MHPIMWYESVTPSTAKAWLIHNSAYTVAAWLGGAGEMFGHMSNVSSSSSPLQGSKDSNTSPPFFFIVYYQFSLLDE
jgi:hypothetical protein